MLWLRKIPVVLVEEWMVGRQLTMIMEMPGLTGPPLLPGLRVVALLVQGEGGRLETSGCEPLPPIS